MKLKEKKKGKLTFWCLVVIVFGSIIGLSGCRNIYRIQNNYEEQKQRDEFWKNADEQRQKLKDKIEIYLDSQQSNDLFEDYEMEFILVETEDGYTADIIVNLVGEGNETELLAIGQSLCKWSESLVAEEAILTQAANFTVMWQGQDGYSFVGSADAVSEQKIVRENK